jgi:hypothetical protein
MTFAIQHIVPAQVLAPRVNRVVFISYLDEAGLSKQETHLVVAGIVVPDKKLLDGENALERVLEKHIPEADHEGFEFHAHDLFTGSNYFGNKHKWPQTKRTLIIKDVLDVLIELDLPVIYGAINKTAHRAKYYTPFDEHGLAFMFFVERIDKWVADCNSSECCLLIADETKKEKVIRSSLRQYRKQKIPIGRPVKLDHITDTIYFADSKASWGLQIADFCNYFIKRHLIGGNELAEKVYQYFKEQIQEGTVFP